MNKSFCGLLALIFIFAGISVSAYSDSVVVDDYEVKINYEDSVVGEIFSLNATIFNDGSSEKEFVLSFDNGEPFDFINDNEWKVTLGAGSYASKVFRIEVDEDADSKNYDLDFNLDNGDDDWDDSFEIKVSSDSADLYLSSVSSSPKKILPDSEGVALKVVLKNKGDKNAEDLTAKIILPEGFKASNSYSDVVYVGDLDSGDSEEITFYFDVDNYLEEGDYDATLQLDYETDSDDESSELSVDLPVFAMPQFKIENTQIVSEGVYSGSGASIKISLKNVGGQDAEDVSLKVYERSDQPFTFDEKSVYVGNLDVGETGYAVFNFDVDKDASVIPYLLGFQVRSVSDGEVIVSDLSSEINVSKKDFNLGDYLTYILGAVLILLFVVVFLLARRK